MKQYNGIKAKYPECLLLFRVGDFYETFAEDAIIASKVLDIVLTKRSNGAAGKVPLAGFPHHAIDTYLPKLVRAGYRVAICDQLEDPKMVKGIVKRGVTDLITPGVIIKENALERKENNFLWSIAGKEENWGWTCVDVSTGEFLFNYGSLSQMKRDFENFKASEVLVKKNSIAPSFFKKESLYFLADWLFEKEEAQSRLKRFYAVKSLKAFGLEKKEAASISAANTIYYLEEIHQKKIQHLSKPKKHNNGDFLMMEDFTIRNLELVNSLNVGAKSLRDVLDYTHTAMGGRLFKRWLLLPLKSVELIQKRQKKVKFFLDHPELVSKIKEELQSFGDFERTMVRAANQTIGPRAMQVLANNLQSSDAIIKQIQESKLVENWHLDRFSELATIYEELLSALVDDAPSTLLKENYIKYGYNEELDRLKNIKKNAATTLAELLEREKEKTGINSLKIDNNNVFGYYFEVRNTYKSKVPDTWIRKQTLVNAERYFTEELKQLEVEILSAEEKIFSKEKTIYLSLIEALMQGYEKIIQLSYFIAELDCLLSFSEVAVRNHYIKPEISESAGISIEDGRHPVIEHELPQTEKYIANSVYLNPENQQILMITGPNMSGKSAVLRQTALITLMAQIGSYVPAKSAKIGLVDHIFTRVGASDNISQGESTFMVEMTEASGILNNLTKKSLVILDEIGRGTATYDGISIAWAIAEYIHQHPYKPLTLFATHYHELNEMEAKFERIKNYTIEVKKLEDKIIFLRKLIPGGSEHSFGIEVAKMAGMPNSVVQRANELLENLDNKTHENKLKSGLEKKKLEDYQLSFFQLDDPILDELRREIQQIDINTLTPVEALLKLESIRKKLGE